MCKVPRQCSSSNYFKNRRCDACIYREKNCQYVSQNNCAVCTVKKGKYRDCEDLPPKCTTDSNNLFVKL